MCLDPTTYNAVLRMSAQNMSMVDIARELGITYHQVNYVARRGGKQPGQPRRDKGTSKYDCLEEGIESAKIYYFKQSRRFGGLSICIRQAHSDLIRSGFDVNIKTFASIVRKRYHADGWDILWASRKMVREFQPALPKLEYDMWELINFNDWWCIDQRQSDMWVFDPESGRMIKPRTFVIWELKTGMPLNVGMQLHDFKSKEVGLLMLETVLKYGAPLLGILTDNGTEQIGGTNLDLFEAFWPPEYIELVRSGVYIEGFSNIFPNARSPIVRSLAYIPTEFGKAVCERGFRTIKDCIESLIAGYSFQGGSRNELVHKTSRSTPKVDDTWFTPTEYYKVMRWAFTATAEDIRESVVPLQGIEQPVKFKSFVKATGMRPTVGNAFQHCWSSYKQGHFPDARLYDVLRHCGTVLKHKRVKDLGRVHFDYDTKSYNFNCKSLDITHYRKYVDVILHPKDSSRAGIFYEGKYLDSAIDVCARMNKKEIAISAAQEMNGRFREEKKKEVRLLSEGYAIAPDKAKLLAGLPDAEEVNVIDIQATDQVLDEMNSLKQISPEADTNGTDISEEMLDIMSRLNQQL